LKEEKYLDLNFWIQDSSEFASHGKESLDEIQEVKISDVNPGEFEYLSENALAGRFASAIETQNKMNEKRRLMNPKQSSRYERRKRRRMSQIKSCERSERRMCGNNDHTWLPWSNILHGIKYAEEILPTNKNEMCLMSGDELKAKLNHEHPWVLPYLGDFYINGILFLKLSERLMEQDLNMQDSFARRCLLEVIRNNRRGTVHSWVATIGRCQIAPFGGILGKYNFDELKRIPKPKMEALVGRHHAKILRTHLEQIDLMQASSQEESESEENPMKPPKRQRRDSDCEIIGAAGKRPEAPEPDEKEEVLEHAPLKLDEENESRENGMKEKNSCDFPFLSLEQLKSYFDEREFMEDDSASESEEMTEPVEESEPKEITENESQHQDQPLIQGQIAEEVSDSTIEIESSEEAEESDSIGFLEMP